MSEIQRYIAKTQELPKPHKTYIADEIVVRNDAHEAALRERDERIANLEAQLAEANAGLNNLAKRLCLNHAATMCGDRYQRNDGKCEICEMQAKMAACEWRPITETDLPKVGKHEIGFFIGGEWLVSACRHGHSFAHYRNGGGTHFRPINPPRQGKP